MRNERIPSPNHSTTPIYNSIGKKGKKSLAGFFRGHFFRLLHGTAGAGCCACTAPLAQGIGSLCPAFIFPAGIYMALKH